MKKRKLTAMLLCFALCVSLIVTGVQAAEPDTGAPTEELDASVSEESEPEKLEESLETLKTEPPVTYLDADGNERTLIESYSVIDSNNLLPAWSAGWYVVQGTVNYPTDGITCSGAVHLILTDGCNLTVKGADGKAGICVGGVGNSLTIYGQNGGTGKLDASGTYLGAGIGGGYNGSGSNITINGGTVTATGADGGAGIGGGSGRAGKNITINGGTVTATGGSDGGAGIGGGSGGNGMSIIINGGTVTATGIDYAAGIGGGKSSSGTDITITGGKVFAQGGNVPGPPTACGAAGIGGGVNAAGSNITISGGEVTAKGGSGGGAGIGGGSAGNGSGSNITISGGTVNAEGGNNGAGIGGGTFGAANNITISGGTVTATGGREGAGIGGGAFNDGRDITITGGFIDASGSGGGEDIGSGKDGAAASGISLSGGCYAREPKAEYVPACCRLTENPDSNTNSDKPYLIQLSTVAYLDASQNEQTLKELYTIIDSTNMPASWSAGWYVVKGTADYTEGGTQTNGITCSGEVHLILTDGCSLSVKGGNNNAGICVSGDGNSLTIYGQTDGSGKLTASGGLDGAGIGGGKQQSGNNITINGGTVTAGGGTYGAGIGGGNNGLYGGNYGFGSNITINGGTVTAGGGFQGAGIGGGSNASGSIITINGGMVTATGGDAGAGIGGGYSRKGSNITINGGTVKAGGGYGGAGIGGGYYGIGSDITINGGYINAKGSYNGEDIGSGEDGNDASGIELKGGCYTNKPDSNYIQSGYFIDDNTNTATKDSYPCAISQKTNCTYLDENGDIQTCADYTVINKYNMPTSWSAGWYVVQGTADYTEGGTITNGITCSGAVHLILTDGCALSVKGADGKAGIGFSIFNIDSNSLTIYGQTNGTGYLEAKGGVDSAGIGGFKDHNGEQADGRNITINGGTVTAAGGEFSAGIGGGMNCSGSNITINGGTVTATGGRDGAGIGGGLTRVGSNITITGGTVTATGGVRGAGIGGGCDGSGSNITITGGTVIAIGGSDGNLGAAGIGGGKRGSGSNIIINGGCVNATGKYGSENIGSGCDSRTASTAIVLKGGCYTNKPDSNYIPDGYFAGNNTDTATKADYPHIIHQTAGCLVLDGDYPGTFSADGEELEAGSINGHNYIRVPAGAKVLTYYEYNTGTDAHTTYPVGMKAWFLEWGKKSDTCTATAQPELDNLLTYCGTSIRVSGKKGIRVVTALNEELRKQLQKDYSGYSLSEYGTVMAWTEKLGGEGLTLGNPNAAFNYAYSKANKADPIFRRVKGEIQYTNVLLLGGIPDSALGRDITMRPYLKLADSEGHELVIYGGAVVRSVGYVACQVRNDFNPGTAAYEYIWRIILAVYGDQYLDEYVSR